MADINIVVINGRLTTDPKILRTETTTISMFTLAVNNGKDQKADFIKCKAFGKVAEVMEKHVGKGQIIGVQGRLKSGQYTNKEGIEIYTTDVNVNQLQIITWGSGEKAGSENEAPDEVEQIFNINGDDVPF